MDKKKMRKLLFRGLPYVLVAVLTATITFSLTWAGGQKQSKLDALQSLILEKFIGEANQTKLEDAAADAMIDTLNDPWSYYIPADQMEQFVEQRENSYVGIGVTISVRADGDGLEVAQVTSGGGAEDAGVLAGDVIVGVNDQDIRGLSVNDVKNLIRGEINTQVSLKLLRGAEELVVSVTRRQIKTAVATGTLVSEDVGLVKIVNFNDNSADETISAIESLRQQGAKKLIFDVRFNPGGYVRELVKILDYLLPEGTLFRMEDYTGKQEIKTSDANCLEMPMAVLVNASSYSAAEFFAAALSEYDAAKILGEQTTGKGYYQNTYLLPDGSAVGLSVGKYYTPKGASLAGKGITPDVAVPVDQETAAAIYAGTLSYDMDPQVRSAIQLLNGQ